MVVESIKVHDVYRAVLKTEATKTTNTNSNNFI